MNLKNNISRISVGTKQNRGTIIPVFLPFAGCPFQCLYCAQDKQSGTGQISIPEALQKLESDLEKFMERNLRLSKSFDKVEIAFYGGTFTALKEHDLLLCLNAFRKIKERLAVLNIKVFGRCSTRPDCLGFENYAPENIILSHLKNAGINLIELGIQSFDDNALGSIGRGYCSDIAKFACQYIKDSGFELGVQLMPGIPNQSVETFLHDVEIALEYKPACVRYYPCLVPDGTGLARLWQAGKFIPWDLQTCVDALGYALHRAWQKEVPIIRLSVAPERDFDENILAGVRHPALGSLIQARALLYSFDAREHKDISKNIHIGRCNDLEFHVPKNFQGFIFGEKNSLKEAWENRIGIENIFFDAEHLEKVKEVNSIENHTTKFAFFTKK